MCLKINRTIYIFKGDFQNRLLLLKGKNSLDEPGFILLLQLYFPNNLTYSLTYIVRYLIYPLHGTEQGAIKELQFQIQLYII